jgi:hypothetical protein
MKKKRRRRLITLEPEPPTKETLGLPYYVSNVETHKRMTTFFMHVKLLNGSGKLRKQYWQNAKGLLSE